MITTRCRESGSVPHVARLGFADGWLLLPPTFLNFRAPVVVVDHAHVGDPSGLGLEPFGARDPQAPLPAADLVISTYGVLIALRAKSTVEILASACLHECSTLPALMAYRRAVLVVGSTYELQSSWAALWTMFIGSAEIINQGGEL